ncbi:PODXL protein, partial [Nyctiprogne leucopyga]|nr:PODXL protein [Nyctiprogne leucopyga]
TTPANPGESGQITTTDTSKVQGTTSASNPGNPPTTSMMSPAIVQGTTSTSNPGNPPPTPVILPTTVQGTTPANNPGNPSSTPVTSPAAVQGTTSPNNPGNPPPAPTTSPRLSQQVSSSTSSRTSSATPAATSSMAQQKISPPANLGSSVATTSSSAVAIHASSPPATPGGLGTAVTSPSSVEAQGRQPSDQLTSTAASTRVTTSSPPPGLKDHGVASPTSVAKQPHSSPSSPVQGLASSTRSGSVNPSVTPFDGSIFFTTSKASLSSPPGSINRVSEAVTTTTFGADQRSHDTGSVSTKPASADQSPTTARPSAPAPGDQTASSSPGHQHLNASFQNEVICKNEVQNNLPIMFLKEAKTCAEWKIASVNVSFFESFCSTGQHTFNASRETCTVMLSSREPQSQHWAVQAVVHREYDPTILPQAWWDGTIHGD